MRDDYDLKEREDEEMSMERYFEDGLADGSEPNNPFEPKPAKKKAPAKKKRSNPFSVLKKNIKKIAIGAGVLAVAVIGIVIAVNVSKRKNDGARFAQQIADYIGLNIASAEKSSGISLQTDSQFPAVNAVYSFYNSKTESKKSVEVQGTHLPQWLIICEKDGENLTGVRYYDFRLLTDSVFGTKRKGYIDPKTVLPSSEIEQVESTIGLEPYCINYTGDKVQIREYRYYYEDADTDDLVSYTISATYNLNGAVVSVTDSRADYMSGLLGVPRK